jgi:NAD(P)-dependent dehydrogenase (short-subunit alcohol dehydrogenase family)
VHGITISDAVPASMKSRWTLDDMPDQHERTMLVTGANDGLGFHATAALAGKGAHVVMACRSTERAERARHDLLSRQADASLEIVVLDLADLRSVERCAAAVTGNRDALHVVMCNAGIMAVPFGLTSDGLEQQMGVNYFGHFALVGLLMPLIRRTPGARVVTTSSPGEKFGTLETLGRPPSAIGYHRWRAYCDSKLAILMLGLMLDEKFKTDGIDARGLSAHPGFTRTSLRTTRLRTETNPWQRLQLQFYEALSSPVERGVLPLLYAATAPEIRGGEYVGLSGLGEVRGWPRITRGQRRAYDPSLRRRLWEASEAATGIRF